MNSNIVSNSFVAISDFHGTEYPLEKVTKYYINEYDKIFILGDATDRGENGYGKGGVELLEKIKKLCEQYLDRVMYVPGNHDTFLYEYIKYNDSYSLDCQRQFDTIKDIDDLRQNSPERLNSLMTWLENLPLQRVHSFNSQMFVFAHAFFDQTLYEENPNYSLKKMYQIASYDKERYKKLWNVLWFRSDGSYNPKDVPSGVIEVIGHTPARIRYDLNLDLKNNDGTMTKVFCVDGGVVFGDEMLKYDGKDYVPKTSIGQHTDTSPKMDDKDENVNDQADLKILIDGIKETTSKHGIVNIKNVLVSILERDPKWYTYFSRGNRDKVESLGIKRAIQLINNYSGSYAGNIYDMVNDFLNRLYEEDAEFKEIAENEKNSMYSTYSFTNDEMNQTQDFSGVFEEELNPTSHMSTDKVISTSADSNEKDDLPLSKNEIFENCVVLYEDGKLIIIGDISEEQLDLSYLYYLGKCAEDKVSALYIFDYDTINSQVDYGQTVQLDILGYNATKYENGTIEVKDDSGKVIHVFSNNQVFENDWII